MNTSALIVKLGLHFILFHIHPILISLKKILSSSKRSDNTSSSEKSAEFNLGFHPFTINKQLKNK